MSSPSTTAFPLVPGIRFPAAPAPLQGAQRRFVPATRFDLLTTSLSWIVSIATLAFFLIDSRHSESGGCDHWFVIPTFLCGVIIGHDMIDWFRGKLDPFDPIGLIGIFGFHWFFISPLMQVDRNYWFIQTNDPRQ